MNREGIKQLLPHREPMLLLDDVTKEGSEAVGHYRVRGDEFFLVGHFPGNPIVPGVILCEMMAQSACILLTEGVAAGQTPMYTGLDRVRFRRPVHPGDTVEIRCSLKRAKPPFYFAQGTVTAADEVCASAEFSFAVTGA